LFDETPIVVDERHPFGASREHARALPEFRLLTCHAGDARRAEAEGFIHSRFRRSHGACIATFMPTLLLLVDSADELVAAAGYRVAAQGPLFLERYLSHYIEHELSARASAPVSRAQIVEVGNFAAIDSHRAKVFMSFMPRWFLERSARWIVFTATTAIRGILSSMGAHCLEVGTADGARVAGGTDEWGRYYANDPRVMAGFLPSARRIPALWRSSRGD
jgi:hypothetical protein